MSNILVAMATNRLEILLKMVVFWILISRVFHVQMKIMLKLGFMYRTAKAEQTYFTIRGGKAKRVDAASVVEAASVCGGKSHFAAKLRICPPRHAAIRDMMPSRCAS
ncbi:hypothetical protein DPMN_145836 [Dreissena polymorpha]|uniref:Uncharacterized protein n=1 Tax=Dreissena polymorpha TaxID=45954 RepID=A0A9D4F5Y4_DREPO|nr:hypothetical protein DPMN_145836 [Dreissena polymorpha]